MKILFHVGVGNKDRPERWNFVNNLFCNLAITMEQLGHECLVWTHTAAGRPMFRHALWSTEVAGTELVRADAFDPDWIFTWNGSSEGDKKIVEHFGKDKMVFAELAFFDHYSSLYFDFKGVNGFSENLTEELLPLDEELYNKIYRENIRIPIGPTKDFVFVPLQDETDTNITQHSPFKTMAELLEYVEKKVDKHTPVLYKPHPKANRPKIPNTRFHEVNGNVHHYIPYASQVIGINSNVLLESLIYHDNVITLGKGISSRVFKRGEHRQYITHLHQKQLKWTDLQDILKIKNSIFYNRMITK